MAAIIVPVRLPNFDSRIIEDLAPLSRVPEGKLEPIIAAAVKLVTNNDNSDAPVAEAAASLQSRTEQLQPLVYGLAVVFWECSKLRLQSEHFKQAIEQLNLNAVVNGALSAAFDREYTTVIDKTTSFGMALPEYQHLDYRLDVEVGRRTLVNATVPSFQLRLDTTQGGENESTHLRANYASMKKLLVGLEKAVDEEKGTHARRFQRYIR